MAYWETFQMVLKLLLAAVPVFVPAQPYGSTQARRHATVRWQSCPYKAMVAGQNTCIAQ